MRLNEKADYKYLAQVILDAKPKHKVYYNRSRNVVNIGGVGYDKGDLVQNFNQKPGSSGKIKNNFFYANEDPKNTKKEIEKLSRGKIKVDIQKGYGGKPVVVYIVKENKITEKSKGLWHNINQKRKRGEKPARKGSKAYKAAVKAGNKLKKGKSESVRVKEGRLKEYKALNKLSDYIKKQNPYGDIQEAEYQGRKVKLNTPMQGDVKKFKVYVKNNKGNVVKVNFGQKGMVIKKDNPEARKSFRARHKCDQKKDKTSPGYWSCKKW